MPVAPKAAQRALLLNDESYAVTLFLLVIDVYGSEMLPGADQDGWSAETIKTQLQMDFGLQLPKENLDKIMAAISVVTTNFFWKDVRRFIELCNIFSGDDFQPDEFDPADAAEILWGITEASVLWPPNEDPDDTEFSPEIRAYIEQVLKVEGIADPPDVLRLGLTGTAGQEIDDTFSDDPEMFNAVWDAQRAKTEELKSMVIENLKEMYFQIQLLPLQNGEKDGVLKQIQEVIGEIPPQEQEPETEGSLLL